MVDVRCKPSVDSGRAEAAAAAAEEEEAAAADSRDHRLRVARTDFHLRRTAGADPRLASVSAVI